jgi:hypothetical protein
MKALSHNIQPSDTLATIEYLRIRGRLPLWKFKEMHPKHHTLYTHVQYLKGLRTDRYRKNSINMRLHEKLQGLL